MIDILALSSTMLGFIIALVIMGYVYMALTLSTIAKKLNHTDPWLAWIPIANLALILQLGNFHWAWVFLILIPILGWIPLGIINIIANWRIFEKRNYPGWLALVYLGAFIPFVGHAFSLANLIIWGLVAWKDR